MTLHGTFIIEDIPVCFVNLVGVSINLMEFSCYLMELSVNFVVH